MAKEGLNRAALSVGCPLGSINVDEMCHLWGMRPDMCLEQCVQVHRLLPFKVPFARSVGLL